MKLFHISDVLSITTGRLVSNRHMDGVYDILNFLTGDNLYTHQLPRASRECEAWLRTQFPKLFPVGEVTEHSKPEEALMFGLMAALATRIAQVENNTATWSHAERAEPLGITIAEWVEQVRIAFHLPKMLPVYELGADMHTRIDPIEEAEAMMGDRCVIMITPPEST